VGRLNDPYPFALLFLDNLFVKLPHSGPMQLWTKMMLGVVTVIKPKQVIPFVVRTHSPGDRLIGVTAIMKEVAVQVSAAMSQVIKREKEDPEFPVYQEANGDGRSQYCDFCDTPSRIDRILSFDFGIDDFWIFPKVTEENIPPGVFRLAIVAVSIDGNPVMRMSLLIGTVAVAHMVPVMHVFVERLRNSQCHRFHDAEQPIQNPGFEEWVMDEVVRNPVDIPGNADGINQAHANQDPPRRIRKHKEKREYVDEMEQSAKNTNRVPFGIG
jgi:hypothetical protein